MWKQFLQETADLVTFTEEIRNGVLFCAVFSKPVCTAPGILSAYHSHITTS